jgi:hypothetical protein
MGKRQNMNRIIRRKNLGHAIDEKDELEDYYKNESYHEQEVSVICDRLATE